MIIDFHTHIFPDKIAEACVNSLTERSGEPHFSDGKESSLIARLDEAGVDFSVNLPVLTKKEQFTSITAFGESINEKFYSGGRILSFGGIHPDDECYEEHLHILKEKGFLGIKIHPDYQHERIDSEKFVRIIALAKSLGLITLTHAGYDNVYPEDTKCTPSRILRLLDKIGGYDKLVLAHLGSLLFFDEVYESLAGEDVYFDTANVFGRTDDETVIKIIEKHGDRKVLFATDSPWTKINEYVSHLHSLGLSPESEERILGANALELLGIKDGRRL